MSFDRYGLKDSKCRGGENSCCAGGSKIDVGTKEMEDAFGQSIKKL